MSCLFIRVSIAQILEGLPPNQIAGCYLVNLKDCSCFLQVFFVF